MSRSLLKSKACRWQCCVIVLTQFASLLSRHSSKRLCTCLRACFKAATALPPRGLLSQAI